MDKQTEQINLVDDGTPLTQHQFCMAFIALAQACIDNFDQIEDTNNFKNTKGKTPMLKMYANEFKNELIKYEQRIVLNMKSGSDALYGTSQWVQMSMEIEGMIKAYIKHITQEK
jgi:hypothetical protein